MHNKLQQNPKYWDLHKKYWEEEFYSLDFSERAEISHDPNCETSLQLNTRIDILIEKHLNSSAK